VTTINSEIEILAGLIQDEKYFRKVSPYIKEEYFTEDSTKTIYKIINNYANKYKEKPNKTVLAKAINVGLASKNPTILADANEKLNAITTLELPTSFDYMVNETEKFCQNRAMFLAISKAINIYENNDNPESKSVMDINAIPDIVKQALAISFDSHVGHEYDMGEEERWAYYNTPEKKIAFEMPYLNEITNNGVSRKTLNILVAGVNVGKTMLLVYLAAMYKRLGYNVLYVTNEINEMELAQRIDASLLNIETDMIIPLGKEKYLGKFQALKESTHGKLFIKEFPTGTCSANKIRALLHELELKKKFKPDIIINDYITINRADTITFTGNTGNYFERVAEEMRAVAMEEDVVMWTAAQFNSEGIKNSDPELTDIGSSLGIGKVADLAWAVLRSEMLDELGQLSFKQMKTRYHKTRYRRWNTGVNIGTQRIYEVEGGEQADKPVGAVTNNGGADIETKIPFKPENQHKKKVLKI
jgi:replicative DNA helicase